MPRPETGARFPRSIRVSEDHWKTLENEASRLNVLHRTNMYSATELIRRAVAKEVELINGTNQDELADTTQRV